MTADATDETLAQQRAERHSVQAVLLTDAPKHASSVRSSSDHALADVRWTARDGSVRTDRTLVDTGMQAGSHVMLWQDALGSLATRPPSPAEAAVEAGVLGSLAGLAFAGPVCALGAVARWRLDVRRIEGWGREWDLAGPQWGHRTS
ncbi:hypothetical protein ACFYR1_50140 [Streptomyces canus]|uniref:Rv1733c family protein n=1 Tax=Streptomyces canus TaxID=58343 RepID=UPI003686011D